ncbi:hypothetical protein B0T18DRAFT_437766 [Schizothecium vesticola]|uniref:Uncharacterized protein n=1 Tax=Schizothecium vesticola TaxID=314040 RepID=A0AA40K985_9PEZI|nr:hypothetical protein B0T18DRAFT_437766 [Schizothecium vesticola]
MGSGTVAQVPQVEARSLSDLNILAANPPQYPHHPEVRESLTLYISRVPGTRDVILSTLRPQKKNVTGEDVINSLYYVHLDLSTDDVLAAPRRRPEDAVSPRSSNESARSVIPRKPLPLSARVPRLETSGMSSSNLSPAESPTSARPLAPVRQPSENAAASPPAPAQPAGAASGAYPPPGSPEIFELVPQLPPRPPTLSSPSTMPLSRKPFGPRPILSPERGGAGGFPVPASHGRPITPTRDNLSQSPESTQTFGAFGATSPSKHTTGRPSVQPFSLTLIRRDPTTGGQWNIGKISSFQTNIPTPETADPSLNPDNMGAVSRPQRIHIRIDTSGYAKYKGMPTVANLEGFRPGTGPSFAQMMKGITAGAGPGVPKGMVASGQGEEGFSRQVVMTYSKQWTTNLKEATTNLKDAFQRRRATSSAADGGAGAPPDDLQPPRRPLHKRGESGSTIASVDSISGRHAQLGPHDPSLSADGPPSRSSPPPLTTEPGPGLRPRGYTFVSPWDGRCEFRTSTNGRSLKCQHILDPKSPKFNPVAVAHNIRDAQAMGRSRADELTSALAGAKPVSELRFNLPGVSPSSVAARGGGEAEGGKGRGAKHHLQGQFSKLLQHWEPKSSDDEWDDDEPMDLSLGKEDAGGGIKGKRAKLGKLIVHDEGLKMLDLVVAANVGVWWTSWGRSALEHE